MTRFRCPYCKTELNRIEHARCPSCGKTMMVPSSLAPHSAGERKRAKERIRRGAERTRRSIGAPPVPSRRPVHLLWILIGMAFLGALIVGRTRTRPERRDLLPEETARGELRALRAAIEVYHEDCGVYPPSRYGLEALISPAHTNWQGPYVSIVKPDPWGTAYVYENRTNTVRLLSTGPDGIAGTEDDVLPPTDWPRPHQLVRKAHPGVSAGEWRQTATEER